MPRFISVKEHDPSNSKAPEMSITIGHVPRPCRFQLDMDSQGLRHFISKCNATAQLSFLLHHGGGCRLEQRFGPTWPCTSGGGARGTRQRFPAADDLEATASGAEHFGMQPIADVANQTPLAAPSGRIHQAWNAVEQANQHLPHLPQLAVRRLLDIPRR